MEQREFENAEATETDENDAEEIENLKLNSGDDALSAQEIIEGENHANDKQQPTPDHRL